MIIDRMIIEDIMAEKQMTFSQLAMSTGIAKQNISAIIRRGTCTPKTAGKIAAGLSVQVNEIRGKAESA